MICCGLVLMISPVAYSASWFNLGNWYGASSGKLSWKLQTNLLPDQITTAQSSELNYVHQNQYQAHGYLWRPWVSNFSIGTLLEYSAHNIHNLSSSTHIFTPKMGTTLNLFPFSNFRGTITTDFTPQISYNQQDGWNESDRTSINYKQIYDSQDRVKQYRLNYDWSRITNNDTSKSYFSSTYINGQQFYKQHKYREFSYWARNYNNTSSDTIESANIGARHNFTPEYNGLVFDNMLSLSKVSSPLHGFKEIPANLNILGDISYKFDEEYVDKSKMPIIKLSYNLYAVEYSDRLESAYTSLSALWPAAKHTSMSSRVSYNYTQTDEIYNARHSITAILPQISRNNFSYARNIAGELVWQATKTSYSAQVGTNLGHLASFSTELNNNTVATFFVSQGVTDSYKVVDDLQSFTVFHSAGFNRNNEVHQNAINIIDSRAGDTQDVQLSSNQNITATHKSLLQKTNTTNKSISANLNWSQTQGSQTKTSNTSAQVKYSVTNSMLFDIKNLKSHQYLSLDLNNTDRYLTYNFGLSYFIGSTLIQSELEAKYLENYNITLKLEFTRLF